MKKMTLRQPYFFSGLRGGYCILVPTHLIFLLSMCLLSELSMSQILLGLFQSMSALLLDDILGNKRYLIICITVLLFMKPVPDLSFFFLQNLQLQLTWSAEFYVSLALTRKYNSPTSQVNKCYTTYTLVHINTC